jgi:branched-chain amino acid transport system substrate-binding protein
MRTRGALNKSFHILVKVIFFGLVLGISVCGIFNSSLAQEDTLKLGISMRILGDMGWKQVQMIKLMFNEVNATGGINGRKIELITYNDECVASKAVDAVNRLIYQDKVLLIIGSTCSSVTLATVPITEKAKIVQFTPNSTATKITEVGSPWIFRTAVPDVYQSAALADYVAGKIGKKRIAILHETDAMGQGFAEGFMERLKTKYRVTPLMVERFATGDIDFRSQLLKAKAANPEVLAIFGHESENARGIIQAKDLGIPTSVIRVCPSAAASKEFPEIGGDAVAGTIYTAPFTAYNPDPEVQKFVKFVDEKLEVTPDHMYSQSYDMVNILKIALMNAKIENISASLAEDRRRIRDALTTVKNYKGVSGDISFCEASTPECRDGNKTVLILQYLEGGVRPEVKVLERMVLSK